MRFSNLQSLLIGRITFAVLSLLLSWQLHISASGTNVPWQVLTITAACLAMVVISSSNRFVLLAAAVAAQFAVHYGASLEVFGHSCHGSVAGSNASWMTTAHVLAACLAWVLMCSAEDVVIAAKALLGRVFFQLQPVSAFEWSNSPLNVTAVQVFRSTYISDHWGRGPPLNA